MIKTTSEFAPEYPVLVCFWIKTNCWMMDVKIDLDWIYISYLKAKIGKVLIMDCTSYHHIDILKTLLWDWCGEGLARWHISLHIEVRYSLIICELECYLWVRLLSHHRNSVIHNPSLTSVCEEKYPGYILIFLGIGKGALNAGAGSLWYKRVDVATLWTLKHIDQLDRSNIGFHQSEQSLDMPLY